MHLGGGRETAESGIDLAVGLVLHKKRGDFVAPGESLATIHARSLESAVSAAEETADTAPAEWLRPVSGAVERPYSTDELMYDKTMGDWRTHAGVDLAAPLGSYVSASAAGTVTDISDDPLYGTTVTIAHSGGYESVYANLAGTPTVEIGDTVAAGETIGAVGDTAICESAEASHLHFAVYADGESVDPAGLMA